MIDGEERDIGVRNFIRNRVPGCKWSPAKYVAIRKTAGQIPLCDRERRRAALEKFAVAVAHEVRDSGRSKALEPMVSADRKVVHDSIHDIDGVASHSDGEEPRRRVVITPA